MSDEHTIAGVDSETEVRDMTMQVLSRNPLRNKGLQPEVSCLLDRNSVGLDVAAECYQHSAATDPTRSSDATREGPFMDDTRELSPDEARPYIVEMLDTIRKEEQAVALNKSRYIMFARRYKFTFGEIAELLDMSEQGVGKAFKRIARSMPEWVI